MRQRSRCSASEHASALLMVPLVARGETIGVAEITRAGRRSARATWPSRRVSRQRQHWPSRTHDCRGAASPGIPRWAHPARQSRPVHRPAQPRACPGERGPDQVAVLFADIDSFKTVNDQLGHVRADQCCSQWRTACVCACGGRHRRAPRRRRVRGAPGGPRGPGRGDPGRSPDGRWHPRADARWRHQLSIGISIGIAFSSHKSTADMLLREADRAMYRAKAAARPGWRCSTQRCVAASLNAGAEAVAAEGRGAR